MTLNADPVKKFLWRALLAGLVLYLGSYLAMVAYIKFGGGEIKRFCTQQLVGKTPSEIEALVSQAGLLIRQQPGLIRVAPDEKRTGHACDLKIADGRVIRARADFHF